MFGLQVTPSMLVMEAKSLLTGSFTKPLAHGSVAGYFLYPIKDFKTSVSCTEIG